MTDQHKKHLTIRFFYGNHWNPLHLLIMAVTRSRVVHCEVKYSICGGLFDGDSTLTQSSEMGIGVYPTIPETCDYAISFPSEPIDYHYALSLIGTPYDYRAGLAYVWPWCKQSDKAMNCVEVCLWAMAKAGLPTPKWLPTPKGLLRWCEKLKNGEVK